ncbi:MAG: hypothetical protein QXP38_13330 [Nitrososphaerota archaeon]
MSSDELSEIKKTLEQHERRISHLENLYRLKPKESKKDISIKEFILQKQPKNNVEKTLVIGYYLENYSGISPFNVHDLKEGFREAKEKVPSNINLAVIENINKGRMMETKEKKNKLKSWILTSTGEKFVENRLKTE